MPQAALNGSRQRAERPALPVTPEQLARQAQRAVAPARLSCTSAPGTKTARKASIPWSSRGHRKNAGANRSQKHG